MKKLLLSGLLLLVFIKIFTFYAPLEINGDNAGYLTTGYSLYHDGIAKVAYLPYTKYDTELYNIGTPMIFSLFYTLTGGQLNLFLFKFFFVLMSLGIFLLLYLLFSFFMEKKYALLLSFIISLNQQILHFSSLLLTEIPFLFFTVLTMFMAMYPLKNKKYEILMWVIAGVSLFFAAMVRNSGLLFIFLFPLTFISLKEKRIQKALIIFLTAVLLLGGWLYKRHDASQKYSKINNLNEAKLAESQQEVPKETNYFNKIFTVILKNKDIIIKSFISSWPVLGQKLVGYPDDIAQTTILAIISGLIIFLGLIYDLFKKKLFLASFLISQIITISLVYGGTTYEAMSRYYFALIPFIYYFFYIGLEVILKMLKNKNILITREKYIIKVVILVFAFFLIVNFRNLPQEMVLSKGGSVPVISHFTQLAEWVKKNIKEDAVIGTRKSRYFYILSGKKGMLYHYAYQAKYNRLSPWSKELENSTLKMYYNYNFDYLILDSFSSDPYVKMIPIIQHYPQIFKVYYFPRQFNFPEGYIKDLNQLFAFINQYYMRTKQIFIPTVLLKLDRKELEKVVQTL